MSTSKMVPVLVDDDALADAREIISRIDEASPEAARRFAERIGATIELLARYPRFGRRLPSARRELRRAAVLGFRNYMMLYQVRARSVLVLRVLHAASQPSGWTKPRRGNEHDR